MTRKSAVVLLKPRKVLSWNKCIPIRNYKIKFLYTPESIQYFFFGLLRKNTFLNDDITYSFLIFVRIFSENSDTVSAWNIDYLCGLCIRCLIRGLMERDLQINFKILSYLLYLHNFLHDKSVLHFCSVLHYWILYFLKTEMLKFSRCYICSDFFRLILQESNMEYYQSLKCNHFTHFYWHLKQRY